MKAINNRRKIEQEFQMAIHGITPKKSNSIDSEEPEFDPVQQSAIDKALQETIARKAREYGR